MGIQDKIIKNLFTAKRKFYDIEIGMIGHEQKLISIDIEEDKYGDREYTITKNKEIIGIIQYPDQEIPFMNQGTANTNSHTIHLYDILPIVGYFKFEDNLKKGDILLQKLKVSETEYHIMGLQIIDLLSRFDTGLVWLQYELAPWTLNYEEITGLEEIINEYYNSDWL